MFQNKLVFEIYDVIPFFPTSMSIRFHKSWVIDNLVHFSSERLDSFDLPLCLSSCKKNRHSAANFHFEVFLVFLSLS